MVQYSNILYCSDFSEEAEMAFHHAVDFCQRYGAQLHLLHVLHSGYKYMRHIVNEYVEAEKEEAEADEELIARAEADLRARYGERLENCNQAVLVEAYTRENGLFYTGEEDTEYTDVLELDLATVEPCVSGPARPQDRITLTDLKKKFADILGCDYERDEELSPISQFHDESGIQTSRLKKCLPLSEYHRFPVLSRPCQDVRFERLQSGFLFPRINKMPEVLDNFH